MTTSVEDRTTLRVLLLEDDERDAELTIEALRDGGYECDVCRVATRDGFVDAVGNDRFDVILADYALPQFDGVAALEIARDTCPHTPFIFVSGAIGEDRAIETLRAGCTDYVLKHRLERIGPAVTRALREAHTESERVRAVEALQRSEESFRLIADMVPQMIWTADPDGDLTYVNQRWLAYVGSGAGPAASIDWERIIDRDDMPGTRERWQRALATGAAFEKEARMRSPDGQCRWFLLRAQPLRHADGRIAMWFGTATDIDDSRRAAELLKSAKEELEAASAAKDEFLAAISHELRTPMTSILGWASLVKSSDEGDMLRLALDSILTSARVQAQLIDDLLEASRLIVGKIALQLSEIDLRDPVRAAGEMIRPGAEQKEVNIRVELPELPIPAHADARRVQQIVSNLLSNAVKFTPAGGLVELSLVPRGDRAVIKVRDTGSGISPEFLPHVFSRFTQERSGSYGGLGLGLAIAHELTVLHGGTIRAESEGPGMGATFIIELPLMNH